MDYIQIISYIIIPGLGMFIIPAVRGLYMRVSSIEQQILTKVSEPQVRQIVADKIDPIYTTLTEMKGQLNQIINRLINDGK